MSVHSHGYMFIHVDHDGECHWTHHAYGVVLDCDDPAEEGTPYCEKHQPRDEDKYEQ